MEDKLIIVSSDSHAGVPKELWSQYLPERYHELLPQLREDNEIYPQAIYLLGAKSGTTSLPEVQEAHQVDWHGLHDPVLRLADMDREGVTAELIYHGDFRLGDMFHNVTGREYSFDAWEDGARGWNRWAADNFGFAMHRFLVTAAIGPCVDMDATVAELEWIADHRFTGTYGPGYMSHRDMPPLFDEYWEPFWSVCEERGIAIVVHAGFGTEYGAVFPEIERIYNDVATAAGSTDPAALFEHADAVSEESRVFFNDFLNHNVDSRRPMWQMMLGGVFDRHPDLKLLLTEIRLDWIPATLRHLDAVYEQHRADLPAKRKPSEYWRPTAWPARRSSTRPRWRCATRSASRRCCSGVTSPTPRAPGRTPRTSSDSRSPAYPTTRRGSCSARTPSGSSTSIASHWPRSPSASAPGSRRSPAAVDPQVRPELIANFDSRGGFLKPAEGEAKLPLVDNLLREDLAAVGVTV